jgi:hypothetical protein
MLSKNKLKWVRSLKMKKFRDLHQAFVVEGEKLVLESIIWFNYSKTKYIWPVF